jgi:hypothetical protein
MQLEVTKVITHFLDFLKSFDAKEAHNMMVIMLDPHFKALSIVEGLVGCRNAIKLASKYDAKVVIPLLMVCFEWLNPSGITIITIVDDVGLELEKNMFGIGTSIEESYQTLIIGELSMFI